MVWDRDLAKGSAFCQRLMCGVAAGQNITKRLVKNWKEKKIKIETSGDMNSFSSPCEDSSVLKDKKTAKGSLPVA